MTIFGEQATHILEKRYLLKDDNGNIIETPEGMIDRVLNYVCNDDEILKTEVRELMVNRLFLPNTPTLMNSGLTNMLSACFAIPLPDNLEGIIKESGWYQSYIHKLGGGVGINFSNLRPKGDIIHSTKGITSGVLGFMKVFDVLPLVIHQGGKRDGANMSLLSVHHPEIIDFIKCKRDEHHWFKNFNLSVLVDDAFMTAVKNNTDWNLTFPIRSNNVYKTLKAREIFNAICESAWICGCPGIVFEDTINKYNPFDKFGMHIQDTNPCVTGDTLVLTNTGYKHIKNLIDKKITIWNGYEWSEVKPKLTSENESILKIYFSDGSTLKCTPYHKFFIVGKSKKIEAKDLKPQYMIPKFSFPIIEGYKNIDNKIAYTKGFFSGDGSTEKTRPNRKSIWLYDEKIGLLDKLIYHNVNSCNDTNKENDTRLFVTLPYDLHFNKTFVPSTKWNIKSRLYWLAGLVDSDGSLNNPDGSVNISSMNGKFLLKVKQMINTLGVNTTLSLTSKGYRLVLAASDVTKLSELGFTTYRVPIISEAKSNGIYKRYIRITKIKKLKLNEPVYCFNEPKNHSATFNGILTSNCGEQPLFVGKFPKDLYVPEIPNCSTFEDTLDTDELIAESCNLGSINLSLLVTKPYTKNANFNFEELKHITHIATRFLDRIIDVNQYPFPFIDKGTKLTRKIGLGITGFSDMLVKLGIEYGSNASIQLAGSIMKTIQEESHKESELIAIKLGTYPLANLIKDKKRNLTTTTIAPTGSIGRIMNNHGYALGIEPPFAVYMKSNIIETTLDEGIHPLLSEILTKYYDNNAVDAAIKTKMLEEIKKNGSSIQHIEELPKEIRKLFRTAHEIPIEQHIAIQAAFQKYTDNACSKTINMDETTTIENVNKAFITGYDSGLKGITIYRNNSKPEQVMVASDQKKTTQTHALLPRPRYQDHIAIIREIKSGCGVMFCGLSFDEHGEFETFLWNSGDGGCSASQETTGRTTSSLLRFWVPVETIVKQLHKPRCNVCMTKDEFYDEHGKFIGIRSCSDGISHQMKDYFKNKTLTEKIIALQKEIHSTFNVNGKVVKSDNLMNDSIAAAMIEDDVRKCRDCGAVLIRQEGCAADSCPNGCTAGCG